MKTCPRSFQKEAGSSFLAFPSKRHFSLFHIKQSIVVPVQGTRVEQLEFWNLLPYVVTSFWGMSLLNWYEYKPISHSPLLLYSLPLFYKGLSHFLLPPRGSWQTGTDVLLGGEGELFPSFFLAPSVGKLDPSLPWCQCPHLGESVEVVPGWHKILATISNTALPRNPEFCVLLNSQQ